MKIEEITKQLVEIWDNLDGGVYGSVLYIKDGKLTLEDRNFTDKERRELIDIVATWDFKTQQEKRLKLIAKSKELKLKLKELL